MLRRSCWVLLALVSLVLATGGIANAAVPLTLISSDPYTTPPGQHATEVEPDSFGFGSTIVEASQVGRIFDGGATNIGWGTSKDGGRTWTHGFLPGITRANGGTADGASDASVAYDAAHKVWLISSLPLRNNPFVQPIGVVTSRSTDGGLTWGGPVVTALGSGLDKNWIVCDNTATSAFYGHCYTEFDDSSAGNRIKMSTSTDGGRTWGPALNTANNASGIGGQPLVQPDGTVVVPIDSAFESSVVSFRSLDGGASWTSTVLIASISSHFVAGHLRTGPLPSAEIDGSGRVYVVWQDCRFRANCSSNDIVLSTSSNGVTWSAPVRIPIDARTSSVDHFVPGLAVDPRTTGAGAHLALTYYFYPQTNCTTATCQLVVGAIASRDGGASWTRSVPVAGPMSLSQIANTSQGRMVGDYISTSYSNGVARGVFAVGRPPSGAAFDEALYTTGPGVKTASDGPTVRAGGELPVAGAASDHPVATTPLRTW